MVKAASRPSAAVASAARHRSRPRGTAKVAAVACASGCFDAPFGKLAIVASDVGIRSISIGHSSPATATIIDQRSSSSSSSKAHEHVRRALLELDQFFARQRTAFTLPLDAHGTDFQLLAWSALSRIPYGCTVSYAQVMPLRHKSHVTRHSSHLSRVVPMRARCSRTVTTDPPTQQAASMGKPSAVRAVGGANGRNPIFLVLTRRPACPSATALICLCPSTPGRPVPPCRRRGWLAHW